MSVASIGGLLMAMRVRYLHRLVLLRLPDLVVLLRFRPTGQPLFRVRLLAVGCEFLRREGLVFLVTPSFVEGPFRRAAHVADHKPW